MKALVIGGGHNGLVAGVLLARAGVDTTVLEAADSPGGCVWTETLPDGNVIERGAVDHGGIAGLAAELGLAEFGLHYVERDRLSAMYFGDGQHRAFEVSAEETAAGLGADGPAYLELARRAAAFFGVLDAFEAPPTPTALAAALHRVPGGDATFRMLLSPAEAVLERTLCDPHTRAALALHAAHSQIPPWAAGSGMFALLLPASHGMPATRPVGGSGALITALVAALEAAGGRLLTGAKAVAMTRSATGFTVSLAGGETLTADRVVSTLDVRRTVALLTDPPETLRAAAAQTSSGRLNVCELTVSIAGVAPPEAAAGPTGSLRDATHSPPGPGAADPRPAPVVPAGQSPGPAQEPSLGPFLGQSPGPSLGQSPGPAQEQTPGTTPSPRGKSPVDPRSAPVARTGPVCFVQDGLDDLRRGFGEVLAGRLPGSPWAMVAGGGTGVWLSSVVPLRRADGPWTPALEREAAARVVGAAGRILGADLSGGEVVVTGPTSWAVRLHGDGNPNHLDLGIDQLLGWRPAGIPVPRTPLPGLYLAGAGTHPGGGLSGASGKAAARALLADTGDAPRTSRRARVREEIAALWSGLRAYQAMRGVP